ncbi:MAG: hypothetical protein JF625_23985 [Inquilinus limosus]|uniref:Uncharacterized protein n=1 Tax=Inquilinus limosus TaxID=171674 RepID=A0A952FNR7_9PROT|nr:hypothetical protein [Inquilinus limosus]
MTEDDFRNICAEVADRNGMDTVEWFAENLEDNLQFGGYYGVAVIKDTGDTAIMSGNLSNKWQWTGQTLAGLAVRVIALNEPNPM